MPSLDPPTESTAHGSDTRVAPALRLLLRRPHRRWLLPSLVLTSGAALTGLPEPKGPALVSPMAHAGALVPQRAAQLVESPVSSVTVYADRAHVTRLAKVTASGGASGTRIELPTLPQGVDPTSIRVELEPSRGDDVAVQRVELAYVDASEAKLPTQEAEKLLSELESLDDQLATLRAEQTAYAAQLRLLGRLLPSANGLGQGSAPGLAPPAKLNPSGWGAVLSWTAQLHEKVSEKSRELTEKQRVLQLKRQTLLEKGQKLGGLLRRGGYRVTATLSGTGTAQLALSYQVSGARWRPAYDIQLLPSQNKVELSLAGLVSQETGEDWNDAKLTLSTAVPATATQLPKLLTWKLGERERFIPMPQPQREYVPPSPGVPQLAPVIEADPSELLQRRFVAKLGLHQHFPTGSTRYKVSADKNQLQQQMAGDIPSPEQTEDSSVEVDRDGVPDGKEEISALATKTPSPPPPPPPPSYGYPSGGIPAAPMAAPAMPTVQQESLARVSSRRSQVSVTSTGSAGGRVAEVIGFGLAPPPGYRPPPQSTALLASASGGYDMVFPALALDTVKSGQGTRRVALLSRSFPVDVSRKIMPALAPEAFLVADIRNQSAEPLPGGQAALFVGADPAGVAQLKLMAPGEVVSLPLGLDRAIRPARNVQVSTIEKGVFSKDEISEYIVTTEIVNPYRVALATRIYDQVPLIGDKNVEIKLLRTEPEAGFDEKTGTLEWRPQVAPGAKLVTKFVYTLKRPKGYKLGQAQY